MFPEIAGLYFTFIVVRIVEQLLEGEKFIGNVGVMEFESQTVQMSKLYSFTEFICQLDCNFGNYNTRIAIRMFQDNFFIESYSALPWHIICSIFNYPSWCRGRRPQQYGVFQLGMWDSLDFPEGTFSDSSVESLTGPI